MPIESDYFFDEWWAIIAAVVAILSLLATCSLWFVSHRWNTKRARTSDFNYHIIDQIIPLLNEIQAIELEWNNNSLIGTSMNYDVMQAQFERFKYRFNIVVQNASDALQCGDLYVYFKFNELDKISALLLINSNHYSPVLFRRSAFSSVKTLHTTVMNGISEMRTYYVVGGPLHCKNFIEK